MTCRIAVCGGTSLGHAIAAALGADPANEVRVLTRQPARWSPEVRAIYLDVAEIRGALAMVTDEVGRAIEGADVVLICTPLQTREKLLRAAAPWLSDATWIGGVPGFGGFDVVATAALGRTRRIFGLQRVPYVRKTISYGEAVWISGIRPRLFVAALRPADTPAATLLVENLFGIPTSPLSDYLAVALSASNAIFHPARLTTAFPAPAFQASAERGEQFYEHWDDEASAAYLHLDMDVQAIVKSCGLAEGEAEPIARHFGIATVPELTARIRAIRALRDRRLPMRGSERALDLTSPYISEDARFALPALKQVAQIMGVQTPHIDEALEWVDLLPINRTQR